MALIRLYPPYPGGISGSGGGNSPPTIVQQPDVPGGQSSLDITQSGFWSSDNAFLVNHDIRGCYVQDVEVYLNSAPSYPWDLKHGPQSGLSYAHIAPTDPSSLNARRNQAMAGTNPTRPVVNLPVALYELRELPMMIHQAGAILSAGRKLDTKGRYWRHMSPVGRAASAHLAMQFGWKPLLSDIKNMILLTDSVERRRREWNKIVSGKGLRRRIKLYQGSVVQETPFNVTNYGISTKIITHGVTNTWATVRWKPSTTYPFNGRPPDSYIRRQLLGLTSANIIDNVWQALPWSWMVDWFTGFGNFLQANQGKGLVTPSRPCVMVDRRTVRYLVPASGTLPSGRTGYARVSSIENIAESKSRNVDPFSSPLQAWLPHLSGGQLSILASLAVTRSRLGRL